MLICILTTAGLYLLSGGGVYAALCRQLIERPQTERMRNVTVEARTSAPERLAVYVPEKTGPEEAPRLEDGRQDISNPREARRLRQLSLVS